jgi:hypothetical protein
MSDVDYSLMEKGLEELCKLPERKNIYELTEDGRTDGEDMDITRPRSKPSTPPTPRSLPTPTNRLRICTTLLGIRVTSSTNSNSFVTC